VRAPSGNGTLDQRRAGCRYFYKRRCRIDDRTGRIDLRHDQRSCRWRNDAQRGKTLRGGVVAFFRKRGANALFFMLGLRDHADSVAALRALEVSRRGFHLQPRLGLRGIHIRIHDLGNQLAARDARSGLQSAGETMRIVDRASLLRRQWDRLRGANDAEEGERWREGRALRELGAHRRGGRHCFPLAIARNEGEQQQCNCENRSTIVHVMIASGRASRCRA
jgi:hypothetical protein